MLQSDDQQNEFKLSFDVEPHAMPSLREIDRRLRQARLHANLVYSHQAYLDVLPVRASKGQAIRYLAYKWELPLNAFLVAGDSGNDLEMLAGDTQAVVVSNHSAELDTLRGMDQVYFAATPCASGILEGMTHYGLLHAPGPTAPRRPHVRCPESLDGRPPRPGGCLPSALLCRKPGADAAK